MAAGGRISICGWNANPGSSLQCEITSVLKGFPVPMMTSMLERTGFPRKWLLSNIAIPLVILVVTWMVLGDLMRNPDHLPGTDTYWHVTLIDEAIDRFKAGEPIGPISESINAGQPYLYDTDTTYPQFAYWVSIITGVLAGGAGTAYGFLLFAASLTAQLTFYFGFRSRFGQVGSVIGAMAFAYAPYTMTSVAPQGRFPALLAIATMPAILAGTMSLIDHPSRRIWVLTAVAVAFSAAFHAMVFYIAVIPIAIIGLIYGLTKKVSPARFGLVLSVAIAGVLLAWILLPDAIADPTQGGGVAQVAVTSAGPGVRATTGGDDVILPFSIRWNSFDVSLRPSNENYAGIGIVLAALIALVLGLRKQIVIFAFGAAVAYALATGTLTPLWERVPLAAQLEPRRFLFPAYLSAGLMIAAASGEWLRRIVTGRSIKVVAIYCIPLVAVIWLLAFDAVPMARRIAPKPDDTALEWSTAFKKADPDGRLFWNANADFAPYYFIGRETAEGTIGRLGTVDAAIRNGFIDTALAELALYNTRAILTDERAFLELADAAKSAGYEQVGRWKAQVLLTSDAPGSIFMNQTRDVGLIGVAANKYWSRIFPNSASIGNPAEIPWELLSSFKVLVLSAYQISDVEETEKVLLDYVNNGGFVIFGEPNGSGANLFGATSSIADVPRNFTVPGADGPVNVLPFTIGGGRFAGVDYEEIGEIVLAGTTPTGETVPLIQRKKMGQGAIYWVCCNTGNHVVVFPGRDHRLARVVRDYFESEAGEFGDVWPTEFDADVVQTGPSEFQISYTAESAVPVLISLESVHKRSFTLENGEDVEFSSIGRISSVVLPAGSHVATLGTDARPFSLPIVVIWVFGLAVAVAILSVGWQPLARDGAPYFEVALMALRRYLSPKWAGGVPIPVGVLMAQMPRIETKYEVLSTDSGTLQKFAPDASDDRLAIVSLEISASEQSTNGFSIDDLRLHTVDGREIKPMSNSGMDAPATIRSRLLSALDRRQPRLEGELALEKGQSISGFVLFSLKGNPEIRSLSTVSNPGERIEFD